IDATRKMRDGIRAIAGLDVLGAPAAQILAIVPAPGLEAQVGVFEVGDAMQQRGWSRDRQGPPDSLHATVSAGNAPMIDEYLADLAACVEECAGARAADRATTYATLE